VSDGKSGLLSTFKLCWTVAKMVVLASKFEVCLPTCGNLYVVLVMQVLHWLVEMQSQVLPVSSTVKICGWIFKIGMADF